MSDQNRAQTGRKAVRRQIEDIFNAGIAAVAPDAALLAHLRYDPASDALGLDGQTIALAGRRLVVLGAGKGAAPMAQAVEKLLGQRIAAGLVIVKYGHSLPLARIALREAAHPVPDQAGADATAELLAMARACTADDLVLCLLTGGASALTPAPAQGISLPDLQETTRLLLASGASIDEINAMRKHLGLFGGGQLARAANGAEIVGIIVSDVIGDRLDVIASGPTVADSSSFADCQAIVERIDRTMPGKSLPAPVIARLASGLAGRVAETPKPGDPLFERVRNVLVATNDQALAAAASRAREHGLEPVFWPRPLEGEAREQAGELVKHALTLPSGTCLLAGGETTVSLRGNGRGGRNQEMALAAALTLDELASGELASQDGRERQDKSGDRSAQTAQASQETCQNPCHYRGQPDSLAYSLACLFAGTDGTDGPTDAAGGFADAQTVARMGGRQVALARLADNDSYPALKMANDLFVTGPTRTNVMDLAILVRS